MLIMMMMTKKKILSVSIGIVFVAFTLLAELEGMCEIIFNVFNILTFTLGNYEYCTDKLNTWKSILFQLCIWYGSLTSVRGFKFVCISFVNLSPVT